VPCEPRAVTICHEGAEPGNISGSGLEVGAAKRAMIRQQPPGDAEIPAAVQASSGHSANPKSSARKGETPRQPCIRLRTLTLAANIAGHLSAWCRLLGLYDCDDLKGAEPDTLRPTGYGRCPPGWSATPGNAFSSSAGPGPGGKAFLACW